MRHDDSQGKPTIKVLLMSDMVDSTQLGARLGDEAMADVWRAHDRLVRDLLAAWNGREIEKTDGVHALFDHADEALGCALAYHRGLRDARLPVSVRAGIHAGPVTLRRNDLADVARGAKPVEVDGLAVSIASRVMATARGGQTLLSGEAVSALEARPDDLRAHGHWRLKGVPEPVELFEVPESGESLAPPVDGERAHRVLRHGDTWLPVGSVEHSLIAERDSFIGRHSELDLLAIRLATGARLVTVLGVGGAGKTRLALRHAHLALADHPGGVWFCDLSQARTLDGVLLAAAQGLKMPPVGGDFLSELTSVIARRGRCLIILDNFEQVVEHANSTLGAWLDAAPQARFIVTSREALCMAGEEVLLLEPLGARDAATLFAERARSAWLGYEPTEQDRYGIAQLVEALDGLPLAIELTAARVRTMSPTEMLAHMQSRLDLARASRGRVDRQATLRATFDWSWELLTPDEQGTLATLSVFEGGIALGAAAEVLGVADALVCLESLTAKSLLRPLPSQRFDMLQTLREYAAERLTVREAASLHWRHFAALSEAAAISQRCVETRNLVVACRAATQAGDGPSAVACLANAWAALKLVGPYHVVIGLANAVLALPRLGLNERALAHAVAAATHTRVGNANESRRHIDAGLTVAGDSVSEARGRLLVVLGGRHLDDGNMGEASRALQRALAMGLELGLMSLQMSALSELGRCMDQRADWDAAYAYYLRAHAMAETTGDRRLAGNLLGNMGGILYDQGQLAAAQDHYERALSLAQEVGDHAGEGNVRCNLGLLHQAQGRNEEALNQFDAALVVARQSGHVQLAYTVQCNLGILLTVPGKHEAAGRHFEQAVAAARSAEDRRAEGQFLGYLGRNLAERGQTAAALVALTTGETLLEALHDPLSLALLLCDRAEAEHLAGDAAAAVGAAERARFIARDLRCGETSDLHQRLCRADAFLAQPLKAC